MADMMSAAVQTSALVSLIDIYEPDIYNKIVGRYPKQRSLEWLEMAGKTRHMKQLTHSHYEENELNPTVLIGAIANSSASSVDITLDSSSVYTVGGSYFSYPRKYARVEFTNGAQGFITAVSKPGNSATHTITVTQLSGSYDVGAAALPGDYLVIGGIVGTEGGSGPDEIIIPTITKFTNNVRHFEDFHIVTTTEEQLQTWVDIVYPANHPRAGQTGKGLIIKAEADMLDRFELNREYAYFTDDAGQFTQGSDVYKTFRGFVPHLKQYGNVMDYISAPTMNTFDTMTRIITKNYGCSEYTLMHGYEFGNGLKNFTTDLFKNGSTVYNSGAGQIETAKLGMRAMGWGNWMFYLKEIPVFNHAGLTAAPGRPYPGMFIAMPNDKVKDTVTTEMMDPLAIIYNPMTIAGGSKRGTKRVWETGGGAPVPTGNDKRRRINIVSEEGPQIYGSKRFIIGTKKANS